MNANRAPAPGSLTAAIVPPCAFTSPLASVSNVRAGIVELIQGALARDTRRIVTAMKTMGFVARGANEAMFEQVIEYFHERFQENISLDSLNLKDIKFDPQKGT